MSILYRNDSCHSFNGPQTPDTICLIVKCFSLSAYDHSLFHKLLWEMPNLNFPIVCVIEQIHLIVCSVPLGYIPLKRHQISAVPF